MYCRLCFVDGIHNSLGILVRVAVPNRDVDLVAGLLQLLNRFKRGQLAIVTIVVIVGIVLVVMSGMLRRAIARMPACLSLALIP